MKDCDNDNRLSVVTPPITLLVVVDNWYVVGTELVEDDSTCESDVTTTDFTM